MKKAFLVLTIFLIAQLSLGQSLLDHSEKKLFSPSNAPRVGLEIELTGLHAMKIAEILKSHLGGKILAQTRIEKELDIETGRLNKFKVHELHIVGSSMGTVIVKPEDNSTSNSKVSDNYAQTRIFEIVTPPIYFEQVEPLQNALDEMKARGALGTLDGFAVAIQVNVEMGEGRPKKIKAENILRILRNYLKPESRENISRDLKVADFRLPYLGMFTPGMMSRILNPNYNPSNKKFFFDFMYRQSLELLGEERAWQMTKQEARELLPKLMADKNFDVLLPVMKYNYIRVSAVLMYLFPKDWISRYMARTGWFHRYPILEFREANSDFILLKRVKQFLGIVQFSENRGEFQFQNNKIVEPVKVGKKQNPPQRFSWDIPPQNGSALSCHRVFKTI